MASEPTDTQYVKDVTGVGRRLVVCAIVVSTVMVGPLAEAGTRSMASTPPTFPAITDLLTTNGSVSTTTGATATTTEVAASGASWSVSAQICGPNNYTTPTAPDCVNHPNELDSATGTISGSQITLQRGTITTTGVPHGTARAGTETTMATTVTLMTSTDEVSNVPYNGVYSVSTGLRITNLASLGAWKAFWVTTEIN